MLLDVGEIHWRPMNTVYGAVWLRQCYSVICKFCIVELLNCVFLFNYHIKLDVISLQMTEGRKKTNKYKKNKDLLFKNLIYLLDV